MRLIQALRFAERINESNIGDLIDGLQDFADQGGEIEVKQKERILHQVRYSDDDAGSVMDKFATCGISPKQNPGVYKEFKKLIASDPEYVSAFNKAFELREAGQGLVIETDTRVSNFLTTCSKHFNGNLELTQEIADFDPSTGGINRGKFELLLGIISNEGNVNVVKGKSDESTGAKIGGDCMINGKRVEIKYRGAKLGRPGVNGKPTAQSAIAAAQETLKAYYTTLQSKNLVQGFNSESAIAEMPKAFTFLRQGNRGTSTEFDVAILTPVKDLSKVTDAEAVAKLIKQTYYKIFEGFFTGEAKTYSVPLIKDFVSAYTKGRTLETMIKEGSISASKQAVISAFSTVFLLHYKKEEGFEQFLVIKDGGNDAVLLDSLLDTNVTETRTTANALSKIGIKWIAPQVTPGAAQGILPTISLS